MPHVRSRWSKLKLFNNVPVCHTVAQPAAVWAGAGASAEVALQSFLSASSLAFLAPNVMATVPDTLHFRHCAAQAGKPADK